MRSPHGSGGAAVKPCNTFNPLNGVWVLTAPMSDWSFSSKHSPRDRLFFFSSCVSLPPLSITPFSGWLAIVLPSNHADIGKSRLKAIEGKLRRLFNVRISLSFNVNHNLINVELRATAIARSDKGLCLWKPGEGGTSAALSEHEAFLLYACVCVYVLQGCRVRLCVSNVCPLFKLSWLLYSHVCRLVRRKRRRWQRRQEGKTIEPEPISLTSVATTAQLCAFTACWTATSALGSLVYQWKYGHAAMSRLALNPHVLFYRLCTLFVSQDDGDPGTLRLVHLGMV